MTAAAALAAAAHPAARGQFYAAALVVAVPVVVYFGIKLGDLVPYAVYFAGVAAFMLLHPAVPGGPLAYLVLPVLPMLAYKEIRGDKRGVKGRRLP